MTNHSIVYRALVVYANEQTGEIRVKIPSRIGVSSDVSISFIGRKKQGSTWIVPEEGEQIIVSADDENMTNIFWLQTSGVSSQGAQTVEPVITKNITPTDIGKLLTSSANCTLTVDSNSGFEVGQRVDVVRLAGTLTVSQGSGSTLLYTPANTLRAINSAASIVCIATNTYLLVGDLG